ncbi:MAG: hypothetical protein KJ584_01525, partial [Candidatus Omnitrophica bacterium]|nr:hypothetical protein [Candidatus Omnitrophota bacterium]
KDKDKPITIATLDGIKYFIVTDEAKAVTEAALVETESLGDDITAYGALPPDERLIIESKVNEMLAAASKELGSGATSTDTVKSLGEVVNALAGVLKSETLSSDDRSRMSGLLKDSLDTMRQLLKSDTIPLEFAGALSTLVAANINLVEEIGKHGKAFDEFAWELIKVSFDTVVNLLSVDNINKLLAKGGKDFVIAAFNALGDMIVNIIENFETLEKNGFGKEAMNMIERAFNTVGEFLKIDNVLSLLDRGFVDVLTAAVNVLANMTTALIANFGKIKDPELQKQAMKIMIGAFDTLCNQKTGILAIGNVMKILDRPDGAEFLTIAVNALGKMTVAMIKNFSAFADKGFGKDAMNIIITSFNALCDSKTGLLTVSNVIKILGKTGGAGFLMAALNNLTVMAVAMIENFGVFASKGFAKEALAVIELAVNTAVKILQADVITDMLKKDAAVNVITAALASLTTIAFNIAAKIGEGVFTGENKTEALKIISNALGTLSALGSVESIKEILGSAKALEDSGDKDGIKKGETVIAAAAAGIAVLADTLLNTKDPDALKTLLASDSFDAIENIMDAGMKFTDDSSKARIVAAASVILGGALNNITLFDNVKIDAFKLTFKDMLRSYIIATSGGSADADKNADAFLNALFGNDMNFRDGLEKMNKILTPLLKTTVALDAIIGSANYAVAIAYALDKKGKISIKVDITVQSAAFYDAKGTKDTISVDQVSDALILSEIDKEAFRRSLPDSIAIDKDKAMLSGATVFTADGDSITGDGKISYKLKESLQAGAARVAAESPAALAQGLSQIRVGLDNEEFLGFFTKSMVKALGTEDFYGIKRTSADGAVSYDLYDRSDNSIGTLSSMGGYAFLSHYGDNWFTGGAYKTQAEIEKNAKSRGIIGGVFDQVTGAVRGTLKSNIMVDMSLSGIILAVAKDASLGDTVVKFEIPGINGNSESIKLAADIIGYSADGNEITRLRATDKISRNGMTFTVAEDKNHLRVDYDSAVSINASISGIKGWNGSASSLIFSMGPTGILAQLIEDMPVSNSAINENFIIEKNSLLGFVKGGLFSGDSFVISQGTIRVGDSLLHFDGKVTSQAGQADGKPGDKSAAQDTKSITVGKDDKGMYFTGGRIAVINGSFVATEGQSFIFNESFKASKGAELMIDNTVIESGFGTANTAIFNGKPADAVMMSDNKLSAGMRLQDGAIKFLKETLITTSIADGKITKGIVYEQVILKDGKIDQSRVSDQGILYDLTGKLLNATIFRQSEITTSITDGKITKGIVY